LVVRRRRLDGGPEAGTPLPPLQPVERPAKDTVEGGGMLTREDDGEEDELSTLYHQLLKTKSTKFAFEPAEQDKDSEIEDEPPKPPKAMIQSPKAKVQPPKATALPRAINPIDDSDDDLTPPPETPPPEIPPPKPRRSGRTAANVSIAMMIEQGPKTIHLLLHHLLVSTGKRQRAGKRADADTSRSLSCLPWKNVNMQ